ncbi:MAG: hypothetical protein JJ953_11825 [Gracilimonas sp.]|uniref:hypothetical protein n=1 Tax=Gracilimonas sp. TaxID=1974203 RepID=UPI001B1FEC51|nr:hypothetical protein [Gracilimonas sp.]MBO6586787.1 hypothetical protein [Gracilimonas sp.]MBO6615444.1 hypothetical protein [Gracilimonas sp.]
MNRFRSPNRLPYNGNPEKSEELGVSRHYLECGLNYVRRNKDASTFYIFEIVGFRDELDEKGLPVEKPIVQLSRSLTKSEFEEEMGH